MATINARLLAAIITKTGLSRAQVYARIKQVAGSELLPNHLAAIRVAADVGITINRYADSEELAELRSAGSPVAPPPAQALPAAARSRPESTRVPRAAAHGRTVPNSAFVVHGRDIPARDAMFAFLRAVGIKPLEWVAAIGMTGKATPYVGEILAAAFKNARAIVVLITPDDLAQLRPDLVSVHDKPYERKLTGQARPNVLFEAGMAFATHPDQTVLVQLGSVREFSDVAGRHVVHISDDFSKRQELATKLTNAGCDVDVGGPDWVTAGRFIDPEARVPTAKKPRRRKKSR